MAIDKFIKAQALQIVTHNYDVLEKATEEILSEIENTPIQGDTAFAYAKDYLKRQGIKEGLQLLKQKIIKYAQQN